MSMESIIIITLLSVIVLSIGIIGNNIDHYHATSITADEFMKLCNQLQHPPIFRKRLFFRTYLAIPHQGFIIASKEKNFSKENLAELTCYNCGRNN